MILTRLTYYFSMLTTNPLDFVIFLLYELLVIAISFSFHEYAHARVALFCGDTTAKYMGRVTLDPRAHLTLWGTLALFLIGLGWGKPVPVDPSQFRHSRRWLDDLAVSVAGIAMNLLLFLVSAALSVLVNRFLWNPEVLRAWPAGQLLNPYTGYHAYAIAWDGIGQTAKLLADLSPRPWLFYVQHFLMLMAMTNLSLAIFNLLPVQPLDGFHILNDLVLRNRRGLSAQTFLIIRYALLAVMLIALFNGWFTAACGAVYTGFLNVLLAVTGQG